MSDFFETFDRSHFSLPPLSFEGAVVIYGAGKTGKAVLSVLTGRGVPTLAFVDEFTAAESIEGVPVYRLENPSVPRTACVIVAVFNRERSARFSEIKAQVMAAGFSHVVSFEQVYLNYPKDFGEAFFWLGDPRNLIEKMDDVRTADALWADEHSRVIFRNQICFRMTADERFRQDTLIDTPQYLPKDVALMPPPYRFVDVGAFDGDTLSAMKKLGACFESILAFEPDMKNFGALVNRIKREGPFAPQTVLFPCGVGRSCKTVEFCDEGAESSRAVGAGSVLSSKGRSHVPVVALDDVAFGFTPNYIKLDVEGFEEEALCGMRKTVESCRPMLAVSVYHRPEDVFALPLLISQWQYPVDFYLRVHMDHAFDTVLYAIPHVPSR